MYCIEYKCNLFSNLNLKYVSSLIELRGGYVVVLWIVGRGGEGSKPPIVFLRPAISFNPHCLCLCVDTVKVARPFYLVYMLLSHSEKWKQIYRGLANFRVLPLGNEINNQ